MSHLVRDLVGHADMVSDPCPTETGAKFADWVHHRYKGSEKNVRCVMGYIVDLMTILDAIFCASSGNISPVDVLLFVEKHVGSGKKDKIHHDIRIFVAEASAIRHSVPQNDLILDRIIDLILASCVLPARDS